MSSQSQRKLFVTDFWSAVEALLQLIKRESQVKAGKYNGNSNGKALFAQMKMDPGSCASSIAWFSQAVIHCL